MPKSTLSESFLLKTEASASNSPHQKIISHHALRHPERNFVEFHKLSRDNLSFFLI